MGEPIQPHDRARIATLRWYVVLFASFLAVALSLYRPALLGPFVSDDFSFIVTNDYVTRADFDLRAILDPKGGAHGTVDRNYMPVVHLVHALEWRTFGPDTRGYHAVNLLLHALNSTLLVALLIGSGVPRMAAIFGGGVFAIHPANVEAVAWISQIRTLLAVCFSLTALLLFARRPLASVPFFALALLSKATAGYALPMAAGLLWAWRGRGDGVSRRGLALALWAGVFALYAPVELEVSSALPPPELRSYPDLATRIRTVAAIGARYLVMAATGYGTSAYHEPEPVSSMLDPWWLAGLAVTPFFLWRIAISLRRRRVEAAWWIGAAAAFAPGSQFVPFFFGIADRYLYFILPGLIGGACLAGSELYERVAGRLRRSGRAHILRWLQRGALAGSLLWAAAFALHANERSRLWQADGYLLEDAASHYPNGAIGHYVRAVLALERGDSETALAELRESAALGGGLIHSFYGDIWLMPLHGDPRFQALVKDMAQMEIDAARKRPVDQSLRLIVGRAYYLRGEYDAAIAELEQALRTGGPQDAQALMLLERVRLERTGRVDTGPFSSAPKAGAKPILDFPSGKRLSAEERPQP